MLPENKSLLLSSSQKDVLAGLDGQHTWLEGPAGTGKTTLARAWLAQVLSRGDLKRVLLLTPQRTLWEPYQSLINALPLEQRQNLELQTLNGLSRQMLSLFWPEVMPMAGFDKPVAEPIYLTVDAGQFAMGQLVRPMLNAGRFATINLPPNRLYSQLLDNLNKSALVGFSFTEVGPRLKSAWTGEPAQLQVYDDVQTAITLFREFCLAEGMIDVSLQAELFSQVLSQLPIFRQYLRKRYQVLIYDNAEEDPPIYHDFILDWLPDLEESLVIYDQGGGLRSFLSADPISAIRLKDASTAQKTLSEPINANVCMETTIQAIDAWPASIKLANSDACIQLLPGNYRFFPELLEAVSQQAAELVAQGTPPEQIAFLSPFVSDVLRFSLQTQLAQHGLELQTLRPSAKGLADPALRNLVTLAAMAYPAWQLALDKWLIANALAYFVSDLDIVRAQGLAEAMEPDEAGYQRIKAADPGLPTNIIENVQGLLDWLGNWKAQPDLQAFIAGIFNLLLAKPGYTAHADPEIGAKVAQLISSVRRFNEGLPPSVQGAEAGKAFLEASLEGLVFGLHPAQWQLERGKLMLLPATTFMMRNVAVDHQFWLGIASAGWYQRLEQPLTHPYVLSRNWPLGQPWTSMDEQALSESNLRVQMKGLLRRCHSQVWLCHSQYGESGQEERGLMLRVLQSILRGNTGEHHA